MLLSYFDHFSLYFSDPMFVLELRLYLSLLSVMEKEAFVSLKYRKTKCILVIVSAYYCSSSSKVIQKYSIFYYTLYCHVFVLRKLLNPSQIRSNRVIVLACQ